MRYREPEAQACRYWPFPRCQQCCRCCRQKMHRRRRSLSHRSIPCCPRGCPQSYRYCQAPSSNRRETPNSNRPCCHPVSLNRREAANLNRRHPPNSMQPCCHPPNSIQPCCHPPSLNRREGLNSNRHPMGLNRRYCRAPSSNRRHPPSLNRQYRHPPKSNRRYCLAMGLNRPCSQAPSLCRRQPPSLCRPKRAGRIRHRFHQFPWSEAAQVCWRPRNRRPGQPHMRRSAP